MKDVYVIINEDREDYSVSWTGNYAGYSLTIKGIYSTEENANKAMNNLLSQDYYSDLSIIKICVDTLSDIRFTYMSEIEDDY